MPKNTLHPPCTCVPRAGNIVLLQFLVGLKQATEDEMVAELVVSVLKGSPDILTRYFKETQFSFSPRIAKAWQDNITLLKKVSLIPFCVFWLLYVIYVMWCSAFISCNNGENVPLNCVVHSFALTGLTDAACSRFDVVTDL